LKQVRIHSSWKEVLKQEFQKPYFEELSEFVRKEYQNHQCYPPASLIFNAFDHCPFDKLKVVIIGQDPYHGDGQANGLCFSVADGLKFPPSLRNIFKELAVDLNQDIPATGNLERWADQGVLLINATLTVREAMPASHFGKGWEIFTDEVIKIVSKENENIVFILWGAFAQAKRKFIDQQKHLILESVHPSPLSAHRGFFGCEHFSKANKYLEEKGKDRIKW